MTEHVFSESMRLAKFIANAGYCSRRQASRLIDQQCVIVNGEVADHICFVSDRDEVCISGQPIKIERQRYYYVFNKPVGVDCRLLPDDPSSLVQYLPKDVRLYPIGRLDKDSHGLLILTNDGEFFHYMNHPEHHQEKEYLVQVERPLTPLFCQQMSAGVVVDGQLTLPCTVIKHSCDQFRIILRQGLNRQIRKMAKRCGFKVIDLQRIRIAKLYLDDLPFGQLKRVEKHQIVAS